MSFTAAYWIQALNLTPHPEGGYFVETYRSPRSVSAQPAFSGKDPTRSAGTAIYYLLDKGDRSAFHKIAFDEIYHYYFGGVLKLWLIGAEGTLTEKILGPDPRQGESFQIFIPGGSWFASEVIEGDYCLSGCTVAPGFDFQDFELADAAALTRMFPAHVDLIQRMSSLKSNRGTR